MNKDVKIIGSNIEIMNLVRQESDSIYQTRIPVATKENMNELATSLLSQDYFPQLNQFIGSLINRIGFTFIKNRGVWRNILKQFKKGQIPYGTDVQEIFVDMAKAKSFDMQRAETEVFKREIPNVYVAYHRMDRQDLYKVTITREQLQLAFVNEYGLADLMTQLQLSLVRGDEYDEYLLTKQLFTQYFSKGLFSIVTVDDPMESQDNTKALLESIRGTSNALTFNSTNFNAMGVNTYTYKDDMVILLNPYVEARIDVQALAYAFNMSKAEIEDRVIVVDALGGEEMKDVYAILVDRDWFMIWDKLYESGSIYNPEGLYWNNTLHHWEILSTSQFCNAVAFMKTPTPTAIAIEPNTGTIKKGGSLQFVASVTGDNSNTVNWTLTGQTSVKTLVRPNGLVEIGSDETATSITLTATSPFANVTKTATITVQ